MTAQSPSRGRLMSGSLRERGKAALRAAVPRISSQPAHCFRLINRPLTSSLSLLFLYNSQNSYRQPDNVNNSSCDVQVRFFQNMKTNVECFCGIFPCEPGGHLLHRALRHAEQLHNEDAEATHCAMGRNITARHNSHKTSAASPL